MMKKIVVGNQAIGVLTCFNVFVSMIVLLPVVQCTSTQTAQHTVEEYYPTTPLQNKQPFTEPVAQNGTHNFAQGNLPFGIGTRFNVAMAENPKVESTASNLYNDYIQPLRRGKILSRTPVEMNYSIMPDKGEAFYHKGGLDTGSIKSSYSFQIGMSRHVYKASDFLNADFWLANGKYNPNKQRYTYRNDEPQVNPFRDVVEEDEFDLQEYTGTV
jgi:hypothetical protein